MDPAGESRGVEGEGSKPTKRTEGGGKDTKATDGSEKKGKGVEEKSVKVKVEDGRKTSDVKSTKSKIKLNRGNLSKSAAIDKARIWKLLNDDCDSDTSSEEGLRGKTWHGRSSKDLGGKRDSGKSVENKLRGDPSREVRSKEPVGSKDVQTKESKTKDSKRNGREGHRHRHSLSGSRTKHSSKSGSKSSKSEARPRSCGRARQSRNNVEADSSTDPKGNGKSVNNTNIWEGIRSAAELLSQEPGPVVVHPFEAMGLNDDIWAAVHKEMVEVAEVLNNMNKDDNEQPSSSTARNSSVPRRHYGAGP